jgi:hypothetical protein
MERDRPCDSREGISYKKCVNECWIRFTFNNATLLDSGGRLYRQNKTGLMELANLERPVTAREIREGKLAGLAKFDECRLEYLSEEDTYGANLLWERGAVKKGNVSWRP